MVEEYETIVRRCYPCLQGMWISCRDWGERWRNENGVDWRKVLLNRVRGDCPLWKAYKKDVGMGRRPRMGRSTYWRTVLWTGKRFMVDWREKKRQTGNDVCWLDINIYNATDSVDHVSYCFVPEERQSETPTIIGTIRKDHIVPRSVATFCRCFCLWNVEKGQW